MCAAVQERLDGMRRRTHCFETSIARKTHKLLSWEVGLPVSSWLLSSSRRSSRCCRLKEGGKKGGGKERSYKRLYIGSRLARERAVLGIIPQRNHSRWSFSSPIRDIRNRFSVTESLTCYLNANVRFVLSSNPLFVCCCCCMRCYARVTEGTQGQPVGLVSEVLEIRARSIVVVQLRCNDANRSRCFACVVCLNAAVRARAQRAVN